MNSVTAEIKMATGEISFRHSDFAVVVFPSMAETYPTDAHIECHYIITSDYQPSNRDWIGLYKVGWTSSNNYIYYEWSSSLKEYEPGKEFEGHILFPSHHMPEDDGEFYQFCYVASTGQVKGASTPFQFKKPRADDFVEMLDDENDMLVIQSKTLYMEENLKEAEAEKKKLLELIEDFHERISEKSTKVTELEKEVEDEIKSKMAVTEDLKTACVKIKDLRNEIEQLSANLESANNEITVLKDKIEKQKQEIGKLHDNQKTLLNEQDAVVGKCKLLQEEAEMYKSQLSHREQSVLETQEETETLRRNLRDLTIGKDRCEKELEAYRRKSQTEDPLLISKKEEINRLGEKLRNSEDKLSAAESTKEMLQKELSTYEITLAKMSADLETAHGDSLTLKAQLEKGAKDFDQFKAQKREEINKLNETIETIKKDTDNLLPPQSIYHLQKVQETLQERYSKVYKQNQELSSRNEEFTKKISALNTQNRELLKERDGWKQRISECSEEYKKIYSENQKYIKKIEKLKLPKTSSSDTLNASSKLCAGAEAVNEYGATNIDSYATTAEKILKKKARTTFYKTLHSEHEKEMKTLKEQYSAKIKELEEKLAAKDVKHIKSKSSSSKPKKSSALKDPSYTAAAVAEPLNMIPPPPPPQYTPVMYGNPYATTNPFSAFIPDACQALNPKKYPFGALPHPIKPTVLPSAKAAAVKASCPANDITAGSPVDTETPQDIFPSDRIKAEKISDDIQICPTCDKWFSQDVSESDFSEHIASHFGHVCPMCKKITDEDVTQEEFEKHVAECMKHSQE
ncbi:tax1-binding protein 1 homolog B-like, partial [Argonauta hians]